MIRYFFETDSKYLSVGVRILLYLHVKAIKNYNNVTDRFRMDVPVPLAKERFVQVMRQLPLYRLSFAGP